MKPKCETFIKCASLLCRFPKRTPKKDTILEAVITFKSMGVTFRHEFDKNQTPSVKHSVNLQPDLEISPGILQKVKFAFEISWSIRQQLT